MRPVILWCVICCNAHPWVIKLILLCQLHAITFENSYCYQIPAAMHYSLSEYSKATHQSSAFDDQGCETCPRALNLRRWIVSQIWIIQTSLVFTVSDMWQSQHSHDDSYWIATTWHAWFIVLSALFFASRNLDTGWQPIPSASADAAPAPAAPEFAFLKATSIILIHGCGSPVLGCSTARR